MHFKVRIAAWLLAILFISPTICNDKDEKSDRKSDDGHGSGGDSGGGSGGSGGGSGGSGGGSGGSGGGSGGSGSGNSGNSGNKPTSMGNMTFSMNGMSGIQLPFPFFPPFGCDMTCQPMQLQIFQQQGQHGPMTTHAPTTQAPTTMPPPKTTTPAQRPSPTTTTYTSQTIIMYPNWCQGWCKFFYQPPPQPVYYQPNCLLFSWMGMGSGMSMGMQNAQS